MIGYGRHSISDADIAAVVGVLRGEFLTQGPEVPAFEQSVAEACGARHGVAVASGTAALHLACRALGLGPGQRLWTSPITFVATANAALYCGAEVGFVDIDPATGNLSPDVLEEKLREAKRSGSLPQVVAPVHLAGRPCDMRRIHALSQEYGFRILEDASHALGASDQGSPVGDCRWSDAAVFSFHPVKMITTGEGGMVMTNSAALANKVALLRTHGITREAEALSEPSHGPWYYEQHELGFHYRLTDLQAALGRSQMKRLTEFVARRRELVARYHDKLAVLPVRRPALDRLNESSWHLYVIRLELDRISRTHRQVFEGLREKGIGVQLHYIPVYRQPYYQQLGFRPGLCPQAEAYYREAISLPLHCELSDAQQDEVCRALEESLAG